MREILFRGRDKDDGKWYTGSYLQLDDTTYCINGDYDHHPENTKHYIIFDLMTDWGLPNRHLIAEVDPDTVGQFTGLTDKNGKKIFEGDFVIYEWQEKTYQSIVTFDRGMFKAGGITVSTWTISPECKFEVIGNVHERKEP